MKENTQKQHIQQRQILYEKYLKSKDEHYMELREEVYGIRYTSKARVVRCYNTRVF